MSAPEACWGLPLYPSLNRVLQAQESRPPHAYSSQSTASPQGRGPSTLSRHTQPQPCAGLPTQAGPPPLRGPHLCPLLTEGPPGSPSLPSDCYLNRAPPRRQQLLPKGPQHHNPDPVRLRSYPPQRGGREKAQHRKAAPLEPALPTSPPTQTAPVYLTRVQALQRVTCRETGKVVR